MNTFVMQNASSCKAGRLHDGCTAVFELPAARICLCMHTVPPVSVTSLLSLLLVSVFALNRLEKLQRVCLALGALANLSLFVIWRDVIVQLHPACRRLTDILYALNDRKHRWMCTMRKFRTAKSVTAI